MLRYLWAAFTWRQTIPGLGPLPLNLMVVAAAAFMGFVHPAFWLIGLGLETLHLTVLASNARFQNIVDALRLARTTPASGKAAPDLSARSAGERLSGALKELPVEARRKHSALAGRLEEILGVYHRLGREDLTTRSNEETLNSLLSTYGKLLVASNTVTAHWTEETDLEGAIDGLEKDLAAADLSPELRRSRLSTLEITRNRLENRRRREIFLQEIEAELQRIEAQFDLALENAAISGKPYAVPADVLLDLTAIDAGLFGDPAPQQQATRGTKSRAAVRE